MFSRKIPSSVSASASITPETRTNLKFYSFRKIIFALLQIAVSMLRILALLADFGYSLSLLVGTFKAFTDNFDGLLP